MIRSIRHFLLISLLISITISSSITAIGNYLLDKQVTESFLDSQLLKVYAFIEILNKSATLDENIRAQIEKHFSELAEEKNRDLFFQVWSKENKLLLYSGNTSSEPLKTPTGFSDQEFKNESWRVYSTIDKTTGVKIIVAELHEMRNRVADDITRNNAYILLVTYPLFGILVWFIVGLALGSIIRVTTEISNRASTHLDPVDELDIPVEIKPLVLELNQLFTRLKLAFERNKRFAADAAHELRTPLAALRTQAQVALKAENEKDRRDALQKVLLSVDRSSHMVTQLLTLSRLGKEEILTDVKPVDLHKLATEIVAYLVPVALEKNIDIELLPSPKEVIVIGNDIMLGVLIRNIVDNAIRYTPTQGEIKISIIDEPETITLRVIDSGPGIPPEYRERVFESFFRILGTTAPGSGLGLAIAHQIVQLHYAQIRLETPASGKGLQFDVVFPKIPIT